MAELMMISVCAHAASLRQPILLPLHHLNLISSSQSSPSFTLQFCIMGGRAKKRRRGGQVKFPQQNRSKFIKPTFSSKEVRERWDPKASEAQNLAKVGLIVRPNNPKPAAIPDVVAAPEEVFGKHILLVDG